MNPCIDQITSEDPTFRQLIMGILKSFIVTAQRVMFPSNFLQTHHLLIPFQALFTLRS